MFRTSLPWVALVANFFIAWGLFAIFISTGRIDIASDLPLWQIVLFSGLVNIVSTILVVVLSLLSLPVILIFAACTLGFGMFLWPGIVMYGVLYFTGMITGFYTITTVWWQAILLGMSFSLARFYVPSQD